MRSALTPADRSAIGGMFGFVLLLHLVGIVVLIAFVVPAHYDLGTTGTYGLGVGVLAYTLGMRHAFDADHIAAIDNTTRKLIAEGGRRPLSVGFWFSLGHSSIVFGLCLLLAIGVRALAGDVADDSSGLQQATGLIGTGVSGAFLILIGVINLVVLVGIVKVFLEMRRGVFDERALEEQLDNRGLMNRILGRVTRAVRTPRRMYLVGLLFGLGFDTATEVGLLALAGSAATIALPWYAVLCLPVIFAAGMSLWDTIDGTFMNFAYGWAFSNPVRKIYYNITLTSISVAFAFVIGGTELLQVAIDQFGLAGSGWDWIGGLDLNTAGFVITGVLLVIWVGSVALWKFGRIEDRWSASLQKADA
jgi:high-affinity nickel-transport protein